MGTTETYLLRDLVELLLVFDPAELMEGIGELRIVDGGALYVLTPEEACPFLCTAAREVRQTVQALEHRGGAAACAASPGLSSLPLN